MTRTTKQFIRRMAWLKTGGRCFYCRVRFTNESEMTLDHVVPYAAQDRINGGTWIGNVVPSCPRCNGIKADLPVTADLIRLFQRQRPPLRNSVL